MLRRGHLTPNVTNVAVSSKVNEDAQIVTRGRAKCGPSVYRVQGHDLAD
jgi:hypothetical protein